MSNKNQSSWYVCYMLAILYLIANIDRYIINLMVEPMKRDFALSDTEVSLLIGITFSLFFVLGGIPIARLADRANRRNILTVGVIFWSVMTAAAGLAQNFWHLFLARIGVGVGEATIIPCAHSIMADTLPAEKLARGFAIFSLGNVLGAAFAYGIGGLLIAWSTRTFPDGLSVPLIGDIFNWQLVFLIVGLPGVLLAILFYFTVREPKRQVADNAPKSMPFKEIVEFLGKHKKVFLSIYGGLAFLQMSAGGIAAWMPALFERRFDMLPAESGPYMLLSLVLPGIISVFTAGWIADSLLAKGKHDVHLRVSAIATFLGILPFGLAFLVDSPIILSILFGTGYFFVFMSMVLCPTALQLISPSGMRSFSAALVMVATMLVGYGTGPTIVALITDFGFGDESKLHYSLAIVAFVCATLTAICYAVGRKNFGELMLAREALNPNN